LDTAQLGGDKSTVIDRAEILRLANEFGLEARIVEKDYVLGWVLAGISRDPVMSETWIFKGGTCLKKCFFETYRFSEDLDFTITWIRRESQMPERCKHLEATTDTIGTA
jgi:predicted nucleotidyltransferase component of viral defense system